MQSLNVKRTPGLLNSLSRCITWSQFLPKTDLTVTYVLKEYHPKFSSHRAQWDIKYFPNLHPKEHNGLTNIPLIKQVSEGEGPNLHVI